MCLLQVSIDATTLRCLKILFQHIAKKTVNFLLGHNIVQVSMAAKTFEIVCYIILSQLVVCALFLALISVLCVYLSLSDRLHWPGPWLSILILPTSPEFAYFVKIVLLCVVPPSPSLVQKTVTFTTGKLVQQLKSQFSCCPGQYLPYLSS